MTTALIDAELLQEAARALARGVKSHVDSQVHLWRQCSAVTPQIVERALQMIADHCEDLRDQLGEEKT